MNRFPPYNIPPFLLGGPGIPRNQGEKNPTARLTENEVVALRVLDQMGLRRKELSRLFNAPRPTVNAAINGTTWSHVKRFPAAKITKYRPVKI